MRYLKFFFRKLPFIGLVFLNTYTQGNDELLNFFHSSKNDPISFENVSYYQYLSQIHVFYKLILSSKSLKELLHKDLLNQIEVLNEVYLFHKVLHRPMKKKMLYNETSTLDHIQLFKHYMNIQLSPLTPKNIKIFIYKNFKKIYSQHNQIVQELPKPFFEDAHQSLSNDLTSDCYVDALSESLLRKIKNVKSIRSIYKLEFFIYHHKSLLNSLQIHFNGNLLEKIQKLLNNKNEKTLHAFGELLKKTPTMKSSQNLLEELEHNVEYFYAVKKIIDIQNIKIEFFFKEEINQFYQKKANHQMIPLKDYLAFLIQWLIYEDPQKIIYAIHQEEDFLSIFFQNPSKFHLEDCFKILICNQNWDLIEKIICYENTKFLKIFIKEILKKNEFYQNDEHSILKIIYNSFIFFYSKKDSPFFEKKELLEIFESYLKRISADFQQEAVESKDENLDLIHLKILQNIIARTDQKTAEDFLVYQIKSLKKYFSISKIIKIFNQYYPHKIPTKLLHVLLQDIHTINSLDKLIQVFDVFDEYISLEHLKENKEEIKKIFFLKNQNPHPFLSHAYDYVNFFVDLESSSNIFFEYFLKNLNFLTKNNHIDRAIILINKFFEKVESSNRIQLESAETNLKLAFENSPLDQAIFKKMKENINKILKKIELNLSFKKEYSFENIEILLSLQWANDTAWNLATLCENFEKNYPNISKKISFRKVLSLYEKIHSPQIVWNELIQMHDLKKNHQEEVKAFLKNNSKKYNDYIYQIKKEILEFLKNFDCSHLLSEPYILQKAKLANQFNILNPFDFLQNIKKKDHQKTITLTQEAFFIYKMHNKNLHEKDFEYILNASHVVHSKTAIMQIQSLINNMKKNKTDDPEQKDFEKTLNKRIEEFCIKKIHILLNKNLTAENKKTLIQYIAYSLIAKEKNEKNIDLLKSFLKDLQSKNPDTFQLKEVYSELKKEGYANIAHKIQLQNNLNHTTSIKPDTMQFLKINVSKLFNIAALDQLLSAKTSFDSIKKIVDNPLELKEKILCHSFQEKLQYLISRQDELELIRILIEKVSTLDFSPLELEQLNEFITRIRTLIQDIFFAINLNANIENADGVTISYFFIIYCTCCQVKNQFLDYFLLFFNHHPNLDQVNSILNLSMQIQILIKTSSKEFTLLYIQEILKIHFDDQKKVKEDIKIGLEKAMQDNTSENIQNAKEIYEKLELVSSIPYQKTLNFFRRQLFNPLLSDLNFIKPNDIIDVLLQTHSIRLSSIYKYLDLKMIDQGFYE